MNNVSLVGRITKDPELRYTANGSPVTSFTIAVDRAYAKDTTDFIPCVAWNQQAEFIGRYVKKGNLLGIIGNIQSRSYQTNQGETRVIIEVVLDSVRNLTPKPQEDNPQRNPQYQPPTQPNPNSNVKVNGQPVDFVQTDDKLPF